MARSSPTSARDWMRRFLLSVIHHIPSNRIILRTGAVLTRALARLGPGWAERIRVFTYNGLTVGICEERTIGARRQGLRLELNLSDNVQRCLFFTGTYEGPYLRFLEQETQPGDTYIDVGGHIGLDAFIVARALARHGRVVCFEPSPDSAALIRSGAAVNGFSEQVEVVECGLANEEGRLLLRADPRMPAGDSGVRSRYNEGPVVVNARLRRFDDWANDAKLHRIDIVKLDVEGGEYDALLGMSKSLIKFRPRAVIVEVTEYRLRQAGTTTDKIDKALADCGYERSGDIFVENVLYRPALLAPAHHLP
jgi:FkbM family methyltransferase